MMSSVWDRKPRVSEARAEATSEEVEQRVRGLAVRRRLQSRSLSRSAPTAALAEPTFRTPQLSPMSGGGKFNPTTVKSSPAHPNGIPVTAQKFHFQPPIQNEFLEPNGPSDGLATADLNFGAVDQSEFDILHAEFGGKSKVGYRERAKYHAADFLPPTLQALLNQDIEIPSSKLYGEGDDQREVGYGPNCHGTAWLAARAFQGDDKQAELAFGDATKMSLATEAYFKEVHPEGRQQKSSLGLFAAQKLKPGDIVQFFDESEALLHTTTYVGAGLFFDKANTEAAAMEGVPQEDAPYRLANANMLLEVFKEVLPESKITVRAFTPKAPLPKVSQVFAPDGTGPEKPPPGLAQQVGHPLTTVCQPVGMSTRCDGFSAVANLGIETDAEGHGHLNK